MSMQNRRVATWLLAGIAAAYLPVHATGQSIFQRVPTPNENPDNELFAVSASSPSDIWAVGESAIHYDGAKWTAFPVPTILGDNTGSLLGVADISPTQAWAVGNGTQGQVIEQWDGAAWSVFPSPPFNAPGESAILLAMTAISANDIWALGNLTDDGVSENLFEHWDGAAWTPTIVALRGIPTAASSDATNDVWAVGFAGLSAIEGKPFVAHYDGTVWRRAPAPDKGVFNAVAALAPNDVWAAGSITNVKNGPTRTLIEHYDGSQWSVAPSPNVGPHSMYQSNRLLGITAISATDIWAFGSYFAADGSGHQKTLLLHWDGSAWSLAPSPNPTKGDFLDDVLFAGVAPSPGNLWIVGGEAEFVQGDPIFGTLAIHSTTAASAIPY
jgi:hypothetical protein